MVQILMYMMVVGVVGCSNEKGKSEQTLDNTEENKSSGKEANVIRNVEASYLSDGEWEYFYYHNNHFQFLITTQVIRIFQIFFQPLPL